MNRAVFAQTEDCKHLNLAVLMDVSSSMFKTAILQSHYRQFVQSLKMNAQKHLQNYAKETYLSTAIFYNDEVIETDSAQSVEAITADTLLDKIPYWRWSLHENFYKVAQYAANNLEDNFERDPQSHQDIVVLISDGIIQPQYITDDISEGGWITTDGAISTRGEVYKQKLDEESWRKQKNAFNHAFKPFSHTLRYGYAISGYGKTTLQQHVNQVFTDIQSLVNAVYASSCPRA